jgi:predicted nucleotidyltransferase
MRDERLQPILAELRARLERVYGQRLSKLVLYGSQARGDAEEGSDIDVLVVLDGPVDPSAEIARTGADVAELSLARNVVVACTFVSSEQFEREESPLLINVRREGVAA